MLFVVLTFFGMAYASAATAGQQPSTAQQHSQSKKSSDNSSFHFEVVSIRPSKPGTTGPLTWNILANGVEIRGYNLWQLFMQAFEVTAENPDGWRRAQMRNAPKWTHEDLYDVSARVSQTDLSRWQGQTRDLPLLRLALQAMLKDRCKLAFHVTSSQETAYDLVVAKSGLKIKEFRPGTPIPDRGRLLRDGGKLVGSVNAGRTQWHFVNVTMKQFAEIASEIGQPYAIRDRTGLTGRYDFIWAQQEEQGQEGDPERVLRDWPVDGLGLTLRKSAGSTNIYVIDHVEKPSPN